jgi:hypothetical protein
MCPPKVGSHPETLERDNEPPELTPPLTTQPVVTKQMLEEAPPDVSVAKASTGIKNLVQMKSLPQLKSNEFSMN